MRLAFVGGCLVCFFSISQTYADEAVEFCLVGELDLGTRLQGYRPHPGEWVDTTWCVVTEDASDRVYFSATGKPNPDVDGGWSVAYGPPGDVRIGREALPDLLFVDSDIASEARKVRRMDPRRLAEELAAGALREPGFAAQIDAGRVSRVETSAHLPMRGTADVVWRWSWSDAEHPMLELSVAGLPLFRARGTWTPLAESERQRLLHAEPQASDIRIPGSEWPASVNMNLIELSNNVFIVDGVRSGFRHLVVRTGSGLVVADAPASWVEFHTLPPIDLVPGYEGTRLSEAFIGFLKQHFPDETIKALALTHFHDDHAGGTQAFAAAGADVYYPGPYTALRELLDIPDSPSDPFVEVTSAYRIPDLDIEIELIPINGNPHVENMLGVLVPEDQVFFVSDIHVPRDDSTEPPAERAATECWFAAWAVDHLPAGSSVINSHSDGVTPLATLGAYLESPTCSGDGA